MTDRRLTAEEIRQEGMQALVERLGPDGAVRFVQQFETGRGDYARDRDAWLANESVETICQRIAQRERGENGTQ